jgi:UPF0755 protein
MNKLHCRSLIVFALFALIFSGVAYIFVCDTLDQPINLSNSLNLDSEGRYLFTIERGSNLKQVSNRLDEQQIYDYPLLVTTWARLNNRDQVQAGDYWITSADTPALLVTKFYNGDIAQHSITFPEGWSFKQWISKLAQIPQFAFLNNMSVTELLNKSGIDIQHPEGWFYPDTYNYSKNDNVFTILKQAHQRMRLELDSAWQARDKQLPYQSAYEALIMASIVEKETGLASERRTIAGVFVRRLQQGMRLQTDPTVIYGMGDKYEGNIRRSDLRQFTPYNTYKIDGLPPTPIAMPGLASIEAALHPESGSSLYFVARGDGSHQFSDTMSQHIEAVRKFQIEQRVKDYQSAPKKP